MKKIKAFVGYSFDDADKQIVDIFLYYLDSLRDIGLEWESAKKAEPKELSENVKEKMEGKNLFIGIFTIKNRQIHPLKLQENRFIKKDTLTGKKNDFLWNTSDWVIQESGYALGKGMKTIFLVEEGLGQIGGLQGNLRYIPFSKSNPSKCFTEINEMITSFFKSEGEEVEGVVEKISSPEALAPKKVELESQSTKEENKENVFGKLFDAIKKGDEPKEKELFERYLADECKEDKGKEVECKSIYYMLRHRYGGKDEFDRMQQLSKDYPEHPIPHFWLGNFLEDYQKYEKASEEFQIAARLSSKEKDKTSYACRAANAFINEKQYARAINILMDRLKEVNKTSHSELFELYKTLASVYNKEDNTEKYFSFSEKALDVHPSDDGLRFELAFAYSKNAKHSLSLHHYLILCNTKSENSAYWNNLGVAYSELGMDAKAVSSYIQAEKLGETLASGNLAHKLINAGFLDDARTKTEDALKKPNCESNVAKAKAKIDEINESEKKKEVECIDNVKLELTFRIDYAEAFVIPCQVQLPLKWKSKYGELHLKVEGEKFIAECEREINTALGLGLLYANPYRKGIPDEEKKLQRIIYTGSCRV